MGGHNYDHGALWKVFKKRLGRWQRQGYTVNNFPSRFTKISLGEGEASDLARVGFDIKRDMIGAPGEAKLRPYTRPYIEMTRSKSYLFKRYLKNQSDAKMREVGNSLRFRPYDFSNIKIGNALVELPAQELRAYSAWDLLSRKKGQYEKRENLVHDLADILKVDRYDAHVMLRSLEKRLKESGAQVELFGKARVAKDYSALAPIFARKIAYAERRGYKLSNLSTKFRTLPLSKAEAEQLQKAGFSIEPGVLGNYVLVLSDAISKHMRKYLLSQGDPRLRELGAKLKFRTGGGSGMATRVSIGGHVVELTPERYHWVRKALDKVKEDGIYNTRADLVRALGVSGFLFNGMVVVPLREQGVDPKGLLYQVQRSETRTIKHGLSPEPGVGERTRVSRKSLLETPGLLEKLHELRGEQVRDLYRQHLLELQALRTNIRKVDEELAKAKDELKFAKIREADLKVDFGHMTEKEFITKLDQRAGGIRAELSRLHEQKAQLEKLGKVLLRRQRGERREAFYEPREELAARHPELIGHKA